MSGHDVDRPAEDDDDMVIALPVVPRCADGGMPEYAALLVTYARQY
jgi:hypothetical protein